MTICIFIIIYMILKIAEKILKPREVPRIHEYNFSATFIAIAIIAIYFLVNIFAFSSSVKEIRRKVIYRANYCS